jgi:hypothetical protein
MKSCENSIWYIPKHFQSEKILLTAQGLVVAMSRTVINCASVSHTYNYKIIWLIIFISLGFLIRVKYFIILEKFQYRGEVSE